MFRVLLAIMAFYVPLHGQNAMVVSEAMSANDHTLADEDGEYSDWIELHNSTTSSIDVGGWHLTDDSADLTKWAIPSPTIIQPNGFLVVFASNKDRAVSGAELHTNFKLKSSGEYLGLVQPDGITIEHDYAPSLPQQYTDVSYGLSFNPTVSTTEAWFSPATPGAANTSGGPVVFDVLSTPAEPGLLDDVVVTAQSVAAPGNTILGMDLVYRVMYLGETNTSMVDDGSGYDLVANDDIWTGHIPAGTATSGEMLRWKVVANSSGGAIAKAPLFLDPTGSPEYFGTVVDATSTSQLPVYHWFVENPSAADTTLGTRSSFYFNGVLYDNIHTRIRGNTSLTWTKHNYKFDFNRGEHFKYSDDFGKAEEFNLNSTWSDKSYFRRVLAWEAYEACGVPSCNGFPVRVQQNNNFFSLATFVEQVDEDFVDRNGLDDSGALYKMFNQLTSSRVGVEKKTREWEDNSDLQALVDGVQLTGPALEQFLFDNVDLPAVINYIAATNIVHDNDHVGKNYYLWRDSDGDMEWQFFPWDKDLTFGRNFTMAGGVLNDTIWADDDPYSHPLFGDSSHKKIDNVWNRLIGAVHSVPKIQEMYLRRLRSVMDQHLQSPSTLAQDLIIENRLDELVIQAAPELILDEQKWGIPSWGTPHDVHADVARLKTLRLPVHREHLFNTHGPSSGGIIPPAQTPQHIAFGLIEDSPISGDENEEFIQLLNPNSTAVDMTGWKLTGGVEFTFPGGCVIPANGFAIVSPKLESFRARANSPKGGESHLVFGPYSGHIAPQEEVLLVDENETLVDTTGPVALVVRDLAGGQSVKCEVIGATSSGAIGVAYSLTGPGTAQTAWGISGLAQPIAVVGTGVADATGYGIVTRMAPPAASGLNIWLQALDISSSTFSNVAAETIQ